jgi:hypothetical protein
MKKISKQDINENNTEFIDISKKFSTEQIINASLSSGLDEFEKLVNEVFTQEILDAVRNFIEYDKVIDEKNGEITYRARFIFLNTKKIE